MANKYSYIWYEYYLINYLLFKTSHQDGRPGDQTGVPGRPAVQRKTEDKIVVSDYTFQYLFLFLL